MPTINGSTEGTGDVVVRVATLGDAAAIAEIERASFPQGKERFELRKVSRLLQTPRCRVLVAEIGGRVAAWTVGILWRFATPPWGRVYSVAAHPDFRSRGLGTALLARIVAELRTLGAHDVFLEARTDNTRAIALYQRMGFVKCADLSHFYGEHVHAIRMRLAPPPGESKAQG